jgi:hypothetical protein
MIATSEMNRTAVAVRSAVVMARIVDAIGRNIERADIGSIRYSILERDVSSPLSANLVPGFERLPLEVDAVIRDSLDVAGLWTIDDQGYNFRHEIAVDATTGFPKRHARYQVIYELVSATGLTAILRFSLKVS